MPEASAFPQLSIPHNPQGLPSGIPGQVDQSLPPMGGAPGAMGMSQQPAPVQASQAAAPEAPQFNEDALIKILQSDSQSTNPEYSKDRTAIGAPGQIAQASIGRNVNERLQIWSKLVGDNNAVLGPDSDVWIRGEDKKFHPADTGHTNMLQDIAGKTGAGIDLTAQALTEIAAVAGGARLGGSGGAKVGAVVGWLAGPGVGSYGRQFLESRLYDVQPDKDQLKRDALIGGAVNTFLGGTISTMVAPGIRNVMTEVAESSGQRAIKVARAQTAAKDFMDSVEAKPAYLGEEGIGTPMADAGQRVYSAVDLKRKQLGDQLSVAKDQIIAASDEKPNVQAMLPNFEEFLKKNGVRFENGIPKKLNDVAYATPAGGQSTVNELALRSPLGSQGGEGALNTMIDDYKAMSSGQMTMEDFMRKIQTWQDGAQFKAFDQRSDSIRSAFAELQHTATIIRNAEVQKRLANDPEMLNAVNKAYHEYSSNKDAIDMVMDAWKQSKNSPEAFAKTFIRPGSETLLSQFKNLTADNPQLFKDMRSAFISEKMADHLTSDGFFNAPTFYKDLKGTGRTNLSLLFTPEELGKIQRSAKIMGNIKTNDLLSPMEGQSVSEAVAELSKIAGKTDLSKPSTWLNWLKSKPKMAQYVSDYGLPEIAARNTVEDASKINATGRMIKNFVLSERFSQNTSLKEALAKAAIPNARGLAQKAVASSPAGNVVGQAVGAPAPAGAPPQGTSGSEAGAMNTLGQ